MKTLTLILGATVMLCGSVAPWAGDARFSVEDAYVRAVPPQQPNSAAFMTITNHSDKDTALVAASSDVAEVVELHTHLMEDGMMRMRQVDKIDVPAGGSAVLQPSGLHIMLIGLKQDLVPGENVRLTLSFDNGDELQVEAPVQKMQMKLMKEHGDMQHMH